MPKKFDEELYIPDEEMKLPSSSPLSETDDRARGTHLLIILVTAIIVVLLMLGGLFAYDTLRQRSAEPSPSPTPSRPTAAENQEPESDTARAEVDTMQALSPSDQLSSIITDLENTRIDTIDAEIPAIESELR